MISVGLTGGIGSGKTTISKIFSLLGISTYNSDIRAKALMLSDERIVGLLTDTFGKQTYLTKNQINTKYLAKIVFKDKTARERINAIVHPIVAEDFYLFKQQHQNDPYIIKESAILFETGIYKQLDKNILIVSPMSLRIDRLLKRDKSNEQEIKNRIEAQLSDSEKLILADFIVDNNESNMIIPQILKIDQELRA
ncbi:MAG: dephospho-CoA kinase [Bacteroidales bacterium]|nr:dephospho-CoA kinase [Bacteroidales bacterium]